MGFSLPNPEIEFDLLFLEQHLPVYEKNRTEQDETYESGDNSFRRESAVKEVTMGGVTSGKNHRCVANAFSNKKRENNSQGADSSHAHRGEQRGGRERQECVNQHEQPTLPGFLAKLFAKELEFLVLVPLNQFV